MLSARLRACQGTSKPLEFSWALAMRVRALQNISVRNYICSVARSAIRSPIPPCEGRHFLSHFVVDLFQGPSPGQRQIAARIGAKAPENMLCSSTCVASMSASDRPATAAIALPDPDELCDRFAHAPTACRKLRAAHPYLYHLKRVVVSTTSGCRDPRIEK